MLDLDEGMHYSASMVVPLAYGVGQRAARAWARLRARAGVSLVLLGASLLVACGAAMSAGEEPAWPEPAKKWFDRATQSFEALDIGDAELAIKNALELEPKRESVRLLAANIALSQLRYDEVIATLEGQTSAAATGLRARAFWYSGQLTKAAEQLDQLLANPELKDPWAEGVVQLARSGEGREPFRVTGALLAVVEMPRVPLPTLIVPIDLNGEPVLAMVATGTPEVVVDSPQKKPAWVSLRFGRRLEVKDVPALHRDLSGLSRRVGAPIKLLLGMNLLRRLNPTFDFYASQLVVRSFAPPPPPSATALEVSYIKGGGMVLKGRLGIEPSAPTVSLLVDTGVLFPLAISDSGWKKAGVDTSGFEAVTGEPKLKQGILPRLTLGAFDLPRIPAVSGLPVEEFEQSGSIHLDGVVGAPLVAEFRTSLVDQGRTLWLEEMPMPLDAQDGKRPPESDAEPVSSAGTAP